MNLTTTDLTNFGQFTRLTLLKVVRAQPDWQPLWIETCNWRKQNCQTCYTLLNTCYAHAIHTECTELCLTEPCSLAWARLKLLLFTPGLFTVLFKRGPISSCGLWGGKPIPIPAGTDFSLGRGRRGINPITGWSRGKRSPLSQIDRLKFTV